MHPRHHRTHHPKWDGRGSFDVPARRPWHKHSAVGPPPSQCNEGGGRPPPAGVGPAGGPGGAQMDGVTRVAGRPPLCGGRDAAPSRGAAPVIELGVSRGVAAYKRACVHTDLYFVQSCTSDHGYVRYSHRVRRVYTRYSMISRVYQPSEALKVKPRIRNHIAVTTAGTCMASLTHRALAW